jgi:hypothetical protein
VQLLVDRDAQVGRTAAEQVLPARMAAGLTQTFLLALARQLVVQVAECLVD